MSEFLEVDEQLRLIRDGAQEVIPLDGLTDKLHQSREAGRPLKVKYGVDPTAPDLHLGHAVPLRKLRQFQDLGHTVILLIGDFTALIGDPSERSATRPQLSSEEIESNAKTYTDQAFKVLDKERTRLEHNSRWLSELDFGGVLKLTSRFTVARLLERDDFAKRYKQEAPISLHEFLYPVMQAYDSVALEADVEMGGTDQTFNMLAGRDLQRDYGQPPQVVITVPILEGVDGAQKMSKSLGNQIGLLDPPEEMFGKVMSIPDSVMMTYFRLASDLPAAEVAGIEKGLADGSLHPAQTKRRLAESIVRLYHSESAAASARDHFDRVFKERQAPQEMPTVTLGADEKYFLPKLLTEFAGVKSGGEARRLVAQGGVKLEGEVLGDPEAEFLGRDLSGKVLQVGKRVFLRLTASGSQ